MEFTKEQISELMCKQAGLPEPEYAFIPNFVCLTIRFKTQLTPYLTETKTDRANGGVNGGVNLLDDYLKQAYTVVKDNSGIKIKQAADLLNRPYSTTEKQLDTLRRKGLIEHRGSDKTGGYYAK